MVSGSRSVAAAAVLVALLGHAAAARAQDAPPAPDKTAAALDLFEKGRRLMVRAETLAEACHALEQSLALVDRGDTLLNLAECHRRQGKSATAWAEFDRALSVGTQVGFDEGVKAAQRFRDYLGERLSRLTVTIAPEVAALPELTVSVNGKPWPKDRWNTASPCDPGHVEITATAKGYKPLALGVDLGPEKDTKAVTVALELLPPPTPVVLPPPPPAPVVLVRPPMPVWPWIVGGAGLILGGVGIGFEVDSRNAGSVLDANCTTKRNACPVKFNYQPYRTRELHGYYAFVGLGVTGLAALGAAGLGLGIWASKDKQAQTTVVATPTSMSVISHF